MRLGIAASRNTAAITQTPICAVGSGTTEIRPTRSSTTAPNNAESCRQHSMFATPGKAPDRRPKRQGHLEHGEPGEQDADKYSRRRRHEFTCVDFVDSTWSAYCPEPWSTKCVRLAALGNRPLSPCAKIACSQTDSVASALVEPWPLASVGSLRSLIKAALSDHRPLIKVSAPGPSLLECRSSGQSRVVRPQGVRGSLLSAPATYGKVARETPTTQCEGA